MKAAYTVQYLREVADCDLEFAIDDIEIIDSPTTRQLCVRGWCFAPSGALVKLYSGYEEIQIQKFPRPDVYSKFHEEYEQAKECGFECRINIGTKLRKHAITIRVADRDMCHWVFHLSRIKTKPMIDRLKRFRRWINRYNFKEIVMGIHVLGVKWFLRSIRAIYEGNELRFDEQILYDKWLMHNDNYKEAEVRRAISEMNRKPLISILIPVYNVEPRWLIKCVHSIESQSYPNWEICLADDCSTQENVRATLKKLEASDRRIKVVYRAENGHISKATNSALEIAKGEFIALVDNDDELHRHALYEIVSCLNANPGADLIYSDEDKIGLDNLRKDPHFKPDWSPDTLLSSNYISHLGIYRKSIVDEIGGFRVGYEGSQDYDLVLRFTEKTNQIYHVPKVLYHWRMIEGSTALGGDQKNYPYLAGVRALEDTISRRGWDAFVEGIPGIPYYNVVFTPNVDDFLSVIILAHDRADRLKTCIDSIVNKTTYKNYEMIVVYSGNTDQETLDLLSGYEQELSCFRLLQLDIPFNNSRLNNEAAKIANGNALLFLNSNVEITRGDWLERMLGRTTRTYTGAVGAKLLYPPNKIQHAGIVLGLGGIAGHIFRMNDRTNPGYFARSMINYNYSAVTGACLMVRKSVFEEIGGFDECLPAAFGDIDFCIKLMKKGYFNLYCADAQLHYHESVNRGEEDEVINVDRLNDEIQYMNSKWGSLLRNDPFYSPNLSLTEFDAQVRTYK